jgi:hypothetical protein
MPAAESIPYMKYESLAGGGSSGASRRVLFDYTRQLFANQAK